MRATVREGENTVAAAALRVIECREQLGNVAMELGESMTPS